MSSKKKIIIVSGYFNPLHKGHLEYFQNARDLGDELYVIVNSDFQRSLKGSKEFMLEDERVYIVQSLKMVDHAVLSIDRDRTVQETIRMIFNRCTLSRNLYRGGCELYFANGGDQNNDTIPEREICDELGIGLIDNLGEKVQSSSWLLKEQE
tara:strand:+ start:1239 stop:1694 length:456 start_codon:yes stop_codon:yes gene_type:complete